MPILQMKCEIAALFCVRIMIIFTALQIYVAPMLGAFRILNCWAYYSASEPCMDETFTFFLKAPMLIQWLFEISQFGSLSINARQGGTVPAGPEANCILQVRHIIHLQPAELFKLSQPFNSLPFHPQVDPVMWYMTSIGIDGFAGLQCLLGSKSVGPLFKSFVEITWVTCPSWHLKICHKMSRSLLNKTAKLHELSAEINVKSTEYFLKI